MNESETIFRQPNEKYIDPNVSFRNLTEKRSFILILKHSDCQRMFELNGI